MYYEDGTLQKTLINGNNYEKEVVSGGSTKEYDYIRTPEGLSAIAVKTNGTRSLYYVQTDHLGSIRVVTTASKGIQTRYYYDAWGKQTPVSGTSITNRGYIGEEHLNDFGLINLNARLYDPVLARFMGMDPYVQAADFTQAYNRYAYGLNNPLCYVDANGELWWLIPVIAAAIFATGNTVAHAIRGDINNVGDFFKYFGQGALAGFALGAAWQFAPLIPYVGQGIQTVMTGYGYIQLGGAAVSTVSGLGQGIFTGDWSALENAGKIFAGNFYLDENRPFIDGVWQGFSRHTWEFIQTGLGHTVGQLRNTFDGVDNVDYFGGATLINVNDNSTTRMWGFTLGPFINSKNLDVNDEMFRHEYGHTLQSKRWGFLYPFVVGIPSALSSNFSSSEQHRNRWYEKDANRYGERYYRKYFRNSLTLTPWDDVRYPRR
jgi:RHS repeat-associated protein